MRVKPRRILRLRFRRPAANLEARRAAAGESSDGGEGGFKPTVIREIPRLFFKVRLWDQNDLIDQFLAVYDKLDEDLRAEIPLKRIWAVAAPDTDEEDRQP